MQWRPYEMGGGAQGVTRQLQAEIGRDRGGGASLASPKPTAKSRTPAAFT